VVQYHSTSSGKGKNEWGSTSEKITPETKAEDEDTEGNDKVAGELFPDFIGTDNAASLTQEAHMETAGSGSKIVTVPVEQSAIAVLIHTPLNCLPEKENEVAKVNGPLLSKEWESGKHTFNQVVEGVLLLEHTPGACEKPILLLARSSPSGTTTGFKRFLGCMSEPAGDTCENALETGEWKTLNKTLEEAEGTKWPTSVDLVAEKGSQLVEAAKETLGSIGYADLSDGRAGGFDVGLWLQLGDSWYTIATVNGNNVYVSPENAAKNGESACEKVTYGPQPAEVGAGKSWGEVRDESSRKANATTEEYPACTLTYDLAWHEYHKPLLGTKKLYTEGIANSVENYLLLIVSHYNLSEKLALNHYGSLPTSIRTKTEAGLKKDAILF
jgi:hypothetical protein